ncbi:Cytochrome c-550 precursor [Roseovarius albus]|uniref:Cytochrome c-550 n=1 Tax=Roseovarius albus TaxID=1247867 RepID=A0A1X6ZH07_9RHOB|nr:cytochrome C [Roseovarius albus]SLN50826.1 Cytochrome c-550 precursor [Roseovarius albus]
MKPIVPAIIASFAFALPVSAQDIEKGEKEFKRCRACHAIASEDETFVKGGKTGPNLYGIIGRTAGSVEGFKYSPELVELGGGGLVWDETNLLEYIADPNTFIGGRSKMTKQKVKNGPDLAAFLATFSEGASSDPGEAAEETAD